MEINVYQPCPCHPDKKIKFCCGKDVIHDLNLALAKHGSKQSKAAVDSLDRLIAKVGPKDCLLTTKVQILVSLGEFELAHEANEQFLSANPGHFLGMEQRAVLLAGTNRTTDAVEALQDAMDHLPDRQIPLSFANAFLEVSEALVRDKLFLAAREHVFFANILRPANESREWFVEISAACIATDLFFGREFQLFPVPEGEVSWKKKFENAHRAYRRGQFRKSLELVERALAAEPDVFELLHARAVCMSALGRPRSGEAWRAFSQSPQATPLVAMEAEGIAQAFAIDPIHDPVKFERVEAEVAQFDGFLERLRSDPTFWEVDIPESMRTLHPPPRAIFIALDRPAIQTGTVASAAELPLNCGTIFAFGRQTDSEAKFVFTGQQDWNFVEKIEALGQHVGDPPRVETKRVDDSPHDRAWLIEHPSHLYPSTITPETVETIQRERLAKFFGGEWFDLPRAVLDNQSPRQAASRPDLKIRLRAFIERTLLEYVNYAGVDGILRQSLDGLGLDPLPLVLIDELEWMPPSPVALFYVDLEKLDVSTLAEVLTIAVRSQQRGLMGRIAQRLLEHPEREREVISEELYNLMAICSPEFEAAHEWLQKAYDEAKQAKRPAGRFLLDQMDLAFQNRRFAGIHRIFDKVKQHLDEPGFAERVEEFFAERGLITPDGRYVLPSLPDEDQAAVEKPSALWTPEQGRAVEGAGTSAGGSGLWLPGT